MAIIKVQEANKNSGGTNGGCSNSGVAVTIPGEEQEEKESPSTSVKMEQPKQQQQKDRRNHHHSREWLIDRTLGTSHIHDSNNNNNNNGNDHRHHRPPLSCCYVPSCVSRCPRLCEINCCCEHIGAIGFKKTLGENRIRRKRFMTVSAIVNVVGFLLTTLSCLAMSTNYTLLTAFPFTNGRIQSSAGNDDVNDFDFEPVELALGLRAVATENVNNFRYGEEDSHQSVYTFDEFCDLPQHDLSRYYPPNYCESCRHVSSTLMISLFISLLAYIPALFTSFGRMYYCYDVNCRKTLALVTTALSFGLSLKTIISYKNNCYSDAYQVEIPLNVEERTVATQEYVAQATAQGEAVATVEMKWTGGVGLKCLVFAIFLKLLELVLHLVLPSPSIARNRQEQIAYEEQKLQKLQQQEQQEHTETEDEAHPAVSTMERGLENENNNNSKIPEEEAAISTMERGNVEQEEEAQQQNK